MSVSPCATGRGPHRKGATPRVKSACRGPDPSAMKAVGAALLALSAGLAIRRALRARAGAGARPAAPAAGPFGISEPRFRTAEQLAPLVAPLLGPDGAALPDPQGGKLILQGEPGASPQPLEALRSLDGALHQYRIESETRSRESLDRAFAGAGGWIDGGERRLGRVCAGASGPRTLVAAEMETDVTPIRAERGGGGEIRETGAATQVRVRPGEAVAIAGVDDAGESRGASPPPQG